MALTPPLEKEIQKIIIDYLSLKRYCFWRNNSGALKTEKGGFIRFGAVGSPDICLIKDGIFFGIEVKRPGGKMSDGQIEFQKKCLEAGGRYHVVTSLDDVRALGL